MTAPPDDAIESPVGRPVALQVSVAADEVSLPLGVTVEMAEPETLDWAETAVTTTVLVMVQENDAELEKLAPSVAVMVTE